MVQLNRAADRYGQVPTRLGGAMTFGTNGPRRVTRADSKIAFALADGLASGGSVQFHREYTAHGLDGDSELRSVVFYHLALIATSAFRAAYKGMVRGDVDAVVADLFERVGEAQRADEADPHMCRKLLELMRRERTAVPGPPSGSDEVLAAAVVVCMTLDWRIRYAWDRTPWKRLFRIAAFTCRRQLPPVPYDYRFGVT